MQAGGSLWRSILGTVIEIDSGSGDKRKAGSSAMVFCVSADEPDVQYVPAAPGAGC